MKKVIIFGNSGSGKTTLAHQLKERDGLAHLDLDTLAWEPGSPPERAPLHQSALQIRAFVEANSGWVIEGCYTDLLELAAPDASEMIFLNLPTERCIENARSRPWEPHKYESKSAQDANLEMLIDWISRYNERTDNFSKTAHQRLYDTYAGTKTMYSENAAWR